MARRGAGRKGRVCILALPGHNIAVIPGYLRSGCKMWEGQIYIKERMNFAPTHPRRRPCAGARPLAHAGTRTLARAHAARIGMRRDRWKPELGFSPMELSQPAGIIWGMQAMNGATGPEGEPDQGLSQWN
jgi:hypothetical protein